MAVNQARRQLAEFPGEKSPGLIEAVAKRRPVLGRRRTDEFPGENPPASLKLMPFRQNICVVFESFPGEKSPGLIEAEMHGSVETPSLADVSGGEIPRPH